MIGLPRDDARREGIDEMRILVVEDFSPLREALVQGLSEAGFAVDAAGNGEDGLWQAKSGEHDVVVLDLMLPKVDGMEILRTMRAGNSASMVLILTARDATEDRIRGLDAGADDYVVKPFVFGELLARVRALVRRKYQARGNVLRVDDLEVDLVRHTVRRAGAEIELSGREYGLLEYLAINAEQIVSRTEIVQHVYDFNASLESNVIDVFVGLLRKKIERPGMRRLLHTRRGRGYLLSARGEGG
jgi:two-component system copper resistance phosphate regulon response regulator CusR